MKLYNIFYFSSVLLVISPFAILNHNSNSILNSTISANESFRRLGFHIFSLVLDLMILESTLDFFLLVVLLSQWRMAENPFIMRARKFSKLWSDEVFWKYRKAYISDVIVIPWVLSSVKEKED